MGSFNEERLIRLDPMTAAAVGAGVGGAAGGIFGRGKTTGLGKAAAKQMAFHSLFLQSGVQNFQNQFPGLMESFRKLNPTFGALESRALSDIDDTARTARLETAFQNRLAQQQSSRGLTRSPTAALQTSFAGLQFGEQAREQAFQNLFNVTQGITQPMALGFLGAATPGLQSDFGLQGLALAAGSRANQQSSILSGLQFGGILGGSSGNWLSSLFGGGGIRRNGNQVTFPSGGTAIYD